MNRNKLVEDNIDFAYKVAWKYARVFDGLLGRVYTISDIKSDATLGLLIASRKFKESMNCSFKTFAYIKIREHILDGIRSRAFISRVPRSIFRDTNNHYCHIQVSVEDNIICEQQDTSVARALVDAVNRLSINQRLEVIDKYFRRIDVDKSKCSRVSSRYRGLNNLRKNDNLRKLWEEL